MAEEQRRKRYARLGRMDGRFTYETGNEIQISWKKRTGKNEIESSVGDLIYF
jgi:hypothetical protein